MLQKISPHLITITVPLSGLSQGTVNLCGPSSQWNYSRMEVQADLRTNTGYNLLCARSNADATVSVVTNRFAAASAGLDFGNQPADDSLHIASDSTADTTQFATIYGIPYGATNITSQTVKLNGTTRVNIFSDGAAANYEHILGVELSAACAGTITLEEASANADIITILTTVLSSGVVDVGATLQDAFGLPIYAVAGGASTQYIGIWGTRAGVLGYTGESIALAGTAPVYPKYGWDSITKVFTGDLASTSTVNVGLNGVNLVSGDIMLSHMGSADIALGDRRYLQWALYNSTTLTTGGANDRLRIGLYA